MSREDSRRRAERAHRLRAAGHTWQTIADAEGFQSRGSARTAVKRYLQAEPAESADEVRRSAGETLRITRSVLLGRFAVASERGDDLTMVALAREVHRNLAQWAQLVGANAPAASEVNLRVEQTPSVIIQRLEAELLALVDESDSPRRLEVIEGAVVS